MAIKGKTGSRGKSRAPARAPRPTPVVVKPAFFLRRRVQVALAFVVGVAAMVAFIWATNGVRSEHDRRDAAEQATTARRAVSKWQAAVNSALGNVQFSDQDRSVAAFTQLSAILDQIGKGKTPKGAVQQASALEQGFRKAADDLDGLSTDVIRSQGLNEFQAGALIDSRVTLVQVFRSGQQAAGLAVIAAGADAKTAKDVADRASALVTTAQTTFTSAYENFYQVTVGLGLASGLPQAPSLGAGS
jgi:hypothetical protein